MNTWSNRVVRTFAGVALTAGAVLATAPPGQAAAPVQAAEPDSVIRGAHFSPTTPGVDVYLGSFSGGTAKIWLSSVSYGMVSPYQRLTPGLYTVSMRSAGSAPTTPPVLSWTLNAQAGKAYTVAGVGAGASVRGIVIDDNLATPPAGKGRVRVIQAASRAPKITVTAVNGPVIASDAAFATTTTYTTVPAGTWRVSAVGDGGAGPVQASSSVAVVAGASTSVLLLDAQSSGITVRTVLDSSASGTVPVGSVPAGGGGMAGQKHGRSDIERNAGLGAAGAVVMLTGASWLIRRRFRPQRGRHVLA